MEDIIIFGSGGHAKVVFDILLKQGKFHPIAFCSLNKALDNFLGVPHYHQDNFKALSCNKGIVAIGDNWIRFQVVDFILRQRPEFYFISALHPTAQIALDVKVGNGTVVMANSVINSSASIGSHVIINTSSSIDHDCVLMDFSSVAPGVALGGNVELGKFSAISIGSCAVHNIKIGSNTVIGAGSVILNSIENSVIAYGCPCKVVKSRNLGERYL